MIQLPPGLKVNYVSPDGIVDALLRETVGGGSAILILKGNEKTLANAFYSTTGNEGTFHLPGDLDPPAPARETKPPVPSPSPSAAAVNAVATKK